LSETEFVLRPYQQEAVDKALKAKRATIKAPTGTGKTVIAMAWLKAIAMDALVIVPTQALIYQSWAPKLEAQGFDVGRYYAYAKNFGPVTVTTFASAISHPELIDSVDVVVVDEIHHLGARTALLRILPKLKEKEYVLGLSSVPEREDLGHEFFLDEFPICYDLSLATALRSGYVSPIEILSVPAPMTEEERKKYESFTKRIQQAFAFCGPDIRRWGLCYNPKTRQYIGRLAIAAMSYRKKLLSSVESKKERVLEIIRGHPDQRVLLFSESVSAIEGMREYLESNDTTCATFHSRIEPWRRQRILEEWGQDFDVLLSCRALEEGMDVKEVAVGILITSGKSKRQYIQRMGRILRPLEGKEAKFYVVYCPGTLEEAYTKTIDKILRTA
jgi:superfamily II DNA or RNA helicase